MFLNRILLIVVTTHLLACNITQKSETPDKILSSGVWRMEMNMNGNTLPFLFTLKDSAGQYVMIIQNAEEKILVDDIEINNDSLFAFMPVFESVFKLHIKDSANLDGVWINYYKGGDYQIPSIAQFNQGPRFISRNNHAVAFGGKYEVIFGTEEEGTSKAIGLFEQNDGKLYGTFATETGDYRYLEGIVDGDSVFLSTFDGSHAFLFKAAVYDSSTVSGIFYSGTHFTESWVAKRNENAVLRNPDSLTFIKEGYKEFGFELPDVNGNLVSLADEQYKNKVVIVQIMGSWCPNCLDETRYLSSLYDKYKEQGLEIVALAFERTKSQKNALKNLENLQKRTNASYTFLLGGATREDKATDALPMLNHIMSYPTAIFIDKSGAIRRIHTGFYGPSTGSYYAKFIKDTEGLINQLINESS